jgi:hypothetical protein
MARRFDSIQRQWSESAQQVSVRRFAFVLALAALFAGALAAGRHWWSVDLWDVVFVRHPFLWVSVLFGALTGAAEVLARYRDEPFAAIFSPPGVWYMLLNGVISGAAYGVLDRYGDNVFPGVKDGLMRSVLAGFGAMVVMRSKLFNFKTESGEEYAVGPDAVLSTFLVSVDRKIDRYRSLRRQQIVCQRAALIPHPEAAAPFLSTSLASYQNLSAAEKSDLNAAIKDIVGNSALDDRLKLIAIGFGLLNVCGEKNFSDVMELLRQHQSPGDPPQG